MPTLLVCTGATITFSSLISYILTPEFLSSLPPIGIKTLILQYGNEVKTGSSVSKDLYERLTQDYEVTKDGFTYKDLKVIAFGYSDNIGKWINEADVIVSHAGTGSMLDCLQQGKPLIVVVNTELMDNHQLDVADAFVGLNYCKKDVLEGLLNSVQSLLKKNDLTRFEGSLGREIEGVIFGEVLKTAPKIGVKTS